MDVIKHKGAKIHVGCGGEVVRGVCLKCGERQKGGLFRKIFGEGPIILEQKDIKEVERLEHRKRIRERKDIFKW